MRIVGIMVLLVMVLWYVVMKLIVMLGMNNSGSVELIIGIIDMSVMVSRYVKNSVMNVSGFWWNS